MGAARSLSDTQRRQKSSAHWASTSSSGFPGDKAIPLDELFEGDLANRFETLSQMVEERFSVVAKKGLTDAKEARAQEMPWLALDTPEQQLTGLAQRLYLNERGIG